MGFEPVRWHSRSIILTTWSYWAFSMGKPNKGSTSYIRLECLHGGKTKKIRNLRWHHYIFTSFCASSCSEKMFETDKLLTMLRPLVVPKFSIIYVYSSRIIEGEIKMGNLSCGTKFFYKCNKLACRVRPQPTSYNNIQIYINHATPHLISYVHKLQVKHYPIVFFCCLHNSPFLGFHPPFFSFIEIQFA